MKILTPEQPIQQSNYKDIGKKKIQIETQAKHENYRKSWRKQKTKFELTEI